MDFKKNELVLKHHDKISNLLGIAEIASKFALSPVNTICELFFGQIHSLLGEIEKQRVNSAIQRILSGIAKDIEDGKDFNPNMVNLNQTNHRESLNQELLEQVLRKCKDEPETKKHIFISNIYRNLVTTSTREHLTADWGHKTIHIAEKMTYQQLILFRWHNCWVPHLMLMPEKYNENKMLKNYGNTPAGAIKSNDIPIYSDNRGIARIYGDIQIGTKKYDYILTYEDYIRLFKAGFKEVPLDQDDQKKYTPDRIIVIDDYQQLKNLGVIELHWKMKRFHRDRFLGGRNEFPCEFATTIAGAHVFNLLFHRDDVIQIPSLNQDIEDLESIIIDSEVAKELGNKYNKKIKCPKLQM